MRIGGRRINRRPSGAPGLHALCIACMHGASILGVANVQVRGVPDDVHRRLKSQAALAGQSLNEFLLARMSDIARTPSVPELADRIRARGPYEGPSSARAVREERALR